MAMVANNWYKITLDALAAPPYTAATYTLTSSMVDLIIGGVALDVFCITDGGAGMQATISFVGGTCNVPSDAVNISSTPAMDTTVMNDGETWYSVRRVDGAWLYYGDQSGIVRALTGPTTLGAFIS